MQQTKEYLALSDLIPLIREVLEKGGDFELHPRGESMRPTIKEGRDTVFLSKLTQAPARDDLLLYRRDSGTYVLHRVVRVARDGTLSMRGDHQYFIEHGIRPDQIVAVVHRYYRGKRERRTDSLRVRLYVSRRRFTYPFRRAAHALLGRVKRLFGGERHG